MQKTNFIILINILIIFIIIGLNGNVNGYEVITQTCEPDQYSQGYCLMEFNNSNFDNNSNSVLQLLHTTCNNNEVLVNTEYVSLDSDVEIANNHTAFKVRAETTEICESTFGVVLLVESNNENYDVITNCTCLSVPPYCVRTCEVANGVGTQVCVSTLRASFWTACNATGCLSGYQLTTINNFTSCDTSPPEEGGELGIFLLGSTIFLMFIGAVVVIILAIYLTIKRKGQRNSSLISDN